MDFLIYAAIFCLGWALGAWNTFRTLSRLLHQLDIDTRQLSQAARRQPQQVITVRVEQINDQFYAYSIDPDQFLAQAHTAELLVQRMVDRLPQGSRVICSREHGGAIIESALKNG